MRIDEHSLLVDSHREKVFMTPKIFSLTKSGPTNIITTGPVTGHSGSP